jgi:uncharacterized membrane protein YccC
VLGQSREKRRPQGAGHGFKAARRERQRDPSLSGAEGTSYADSENGRYVTRDGMWRRPLTDTSFDQASNRRRSTSAILADAFEAAGPPLLFGLRLWASVCLSLYIAFWLELDNPYWAGTSAAFVCQPQLGASLRKGWYRMIGTLIGAGAIVWLTAWVPQDRALYLMGLALWCAACALVATLLHNFASYAAALAGFTAVIIASDDLGTTGGPSGQAFMLAVSRATEICIGIVCAGIVLAGTDLGGARRKLATSLAVLTAEIADRFTGMLALAGPELPETMPARRELLRRVIALDPIIDQAKGESSQLRYHSPILQTTVDGLLAALAGWRAVAVLLARLPDDTARHEADAVRRIVPQELRSADRAEPTDWPGDPIRLRRTCEASVDTLIALPTNAPSLRLLADQTAAVLAGISDALNGLALLVAEPERSVRHRSVEFRVPDWMPSLVSAGRAFVAIGAVGLFWIATAWPSGAAALVFTAIVVLIFAPRTARAYASAADYVVGTVVAAMFAALVKFAVLPRLESFEAFSIVIGLYLVPVGALMAQPRQMTTFTAMAGMFVPLLAPANQMSYDTAQFYNASLAIVAGAGAAALSFLLVPPLSTAVHTRRLLALSLSDLRRLATSNAHWTLDQWAGRLYGRLAAMPDEAEAVQRARLLAALLVGTEIIHLRQVEPRLGFGSCLDAAFTAIAAGKSRVAAARLAELDARLASHHGDGPTASIALRGRASILAISEALDEHASYFGTGAPR